MLTSGPGQLATEQKHGHSRKSVPSLIASDLNARAWAPLRTCRARAPGVWEWECRRCVCVRPQTTLQTTAKRSKCTLFLQRRTCFQAAHERARTTAVASVDTAAKGCSARTYKTCPWGTLKALRGPAGVQTRWIKTAAALKFPAERPMRWWAGQALDWDGLTKKLRRGSREEEKIPSVGSHFCDDSQGGFGFPRTNKDRCEGDGHDSAGQLTGPKGTRAQRAQGQRRITRSAGRSPCMMTPSVSVLGFCNCHCTRSMMMLSVSVHGFCDCHCTRSMTLLHAAAAHCCCMLLLHADAVFCCLRRALAHAEPDAVFCCSCRARRYLPLLMQSPTLSSVAHVEPDAVFCCSFFLQLLQRVADAPTFSVP